MRRRAHNSNDCALCTGRGTPQRLDRNLSGGGVECNDYDRAANVVRQKQRFAITAASSHFNYSDNFPILVTSSLLFAVRHGLGQESRCQLQFPQRQAPERQVRLLAAVHSCR